MFKEVIDAVAAVDLVVEVKVKVLGVRGKEVSPKIEERESVKLPVETGESRVTDTELSKLDS